MNAISCSQQKDTWSSLVVFVLPNKLNNELLRSDYVCGMRKIRRTKFIETKPVDKTKPDKTGHVITACYAGWLKAKELLRHLWVCIFLLRQYFEGNAVIGSKAMLRLHFFGLLVKPWHPSGKHLVRWRIFRYILLPMAVLQLNGR